MLVVLVLLSPIVVIAEESTDAAPHFGGSAPAASSAPADAKPNVPTAAPAASTAPAPEAAPAPSTATPDVKPALNYGEKAKAKPELGPDSEKKENAKTVLSLMDVLKYGLGCIVVLVIICKMCSSSSKKKEASAPEPPHNDKPVNRRAELRLGMTADELKELYGQPVEVKRNITKNKSIIIYCYKPKPTRQGNVNYGLEVTFENGRVTKFVD